MCTTEGSAADTIGPSPTMNSPSPTVQFLQILAGAQTRSLNQVDVTSASSSKKGVDKSQEWSTARGYYNDIWATGSITGTAGDS